MNEHIYYIALDFDGTVVKHEYPDVGEDIGAVPVLQRLVRNGHLIILNTMRSRNSEGYDTLQPAIEWFQKNGIPLYGINENPTQKEWTSSPKVYGNIYIDDAALGAPVKVDITSEGQIISAKYLDWGIASIHLFYEGLLNENDIAELIDSGTIDHDLINKLVLSGFQQK